MTNQCEVTTLPRVKSGIWGGRHC